MDSVNSPYKMLLMAAISIPISHYFLGLLLILFVFLYNFLEMHFLQDLLTGFKGQPVILTFSPSSKLYQDVISKCRILHGRYLSTPWLCSPHLQTVFLTYFGNAPVVKYRRQLFIADDGGTVPLDWVINEDVMKPAAQLNNALQYNDRTPIVMIIPGLASHSGSPYVKHLALKMAKSGRNVAVINHRGLGGVSLTSDWFYHGGWSGDIRAVVKHFNSQCPEAPIFLVGTSIGANLLTFYLGEDGFDVPIVGAAAICCPWDPLICDRFLSRRIAQTIYSKAIAAGLKVYANWHKAVLSRISNWEGIEKTRNIRDFDNSAFRILAKCETVDTYYRRGCSINVLGNVRVPYLCISSMDDPICTSEAIPWDECRLNDNVILATTQHGGHLPHFEGLRGRSLWWVRAVDEFFSVLQYSSFGSRKKEVHVPVSSVNDVKPSQLPIVNVSNSLVDETVSLQLHDTVVNHGTMGKCNGEDTVCKEGNDTNELIDISHTQKHNSSKVVSVRNKKSSTQLSLWNQKSLWLLAYKTMSTSWPFLGVAFALLFRKKFKKLFSPTSITR